MRVPWLVLVTCAALAVGAPVRAADPDGAQEARPAAVGRRAPAERARKRPQDARLKYQGSVSLEAVADLNAAREQIGYERPDGLAYLFADGRLEARIARSLLRIDAELGGKLFAQVSSEDMLAGRLAATWSVPLARRLALSLDAAYKDKLQRGIDADESPDDTCVRPAGETAWRCSRDYRTAKAGAAVEGYAGDFGLRLRAGASGFQYKPSDWFTRFGPDGGVSLSYRAGRLHVLTAFGGWALRWYPASPIYRRVPGSSIFGAVGTGREEQVLSGGLAWRMRGPVPLSLTWTASSSRNNSEGMDVVRHRLEAAGAFRLWKRTTVVASAALQLGHYPDGNALSALSLIGDESEQQSALALKVTHRLTGRVSLVAKAQSYFNELSADVRPFRRQVVHAGVQVDL